MEGPVLGTDKMERGTAEATKMRFPGMMTEIAPKTRRTGLGATTMVPIIGGAVEPGMSRVQLGGERLAATSVADRGGPSRMTRGPMGLLEAVASRTESKTGLSIGTVVARSVGCSLETGEAAINEVMTASRRTRLEPEESGEAAAARVVMLGFTAVYR